MMDRIFINEMEVSTHIGLENEERQTAQKLKISLIMFRNLQHAGKKDSIQKTVNYAKVYECVHEIATSRPRKLIETLAEEIAEKILSTFSVNKIEVTIHKFILPKTKSVGISISRRSP